MSELKLWRRHLKGCPARGRDSKDCRCPVWCDGRTQGRRIRYSLQTTSWERAQRKLDRMLDPSTPPPEMPVREAIENYLEDCAARKLAPSTIRSYRKTLEHFAGFCSHEAYPTLGTVTLEALTTFRASRRGRKSDEPAKASTLRKEIECLRAFCAFSLEREWMQMNLAKKLKPPKESGPATLPFDKNETDRIFEASRKMGNREHQAMSEARIRIETFIGLLLYSGLRISDAAALSRSRLNPNTGHLFICQMKTGAPLSVKLPDSLVKDLIALPSSPYFFWTGKGKLSTLVGNLRATIGSVLQLAGVTGHPHRFRDTFAVQLLEQDVPIRTVQLLLGHKSVRTTEKHYAHFLSSQQKLLDAAVAKLDFSVSSSSEHGSDGESPKIPVKNRLRNSKKKMRASSA